MRLRTTGLDLLARGSEFSFVNAIHPSSVCFLTWKEGCDVGEFPPGDSWGTAGKVVERSPGVGEQCMIMEILSTSSPSGRKRFHFKQEWKKLLWLKHLHITGWLINISTTSRQVVGGCLLHYISFQLVCSVLGFGLSHLWTSWIRAQQTTSSSHSQ